MSTENETPQMLTGGDAGPFLRRPLVSVDGDGTTWYLYQIRFMHKGKALATSVYARDDSEVLDIVDSLKQTAIADSRLMPVVRRAGERA